MAVFTGVDFSKKPGDREISQAYLLHRPADLE
jgi:hypothetical protein